MTKSENNSYIYFSPSTILCFSLCHSLSNELVISIFQLLNHLVCITHFFVNPLKIVTSFFKEDIIRPTMWFFNEGWITSNYYSNTVGGWEYRSYRPIALVNFKFKIITKVLVDILDQVLPHIISKEKRGFIHGRIIKDCICLTSEGANIIHKKTLEGNLMMKVDIAKAFDTLDWSFLLKALVQFGFTETFWLWIKRKV